MNLRAMPLFLEEKKRRKGRKKKPTKKPNPPKIKYIQLWPIRRFCSLNSSEKNGEGEEGRQ